MKYPLTIVIPARREEETILVTLNSLKKKVRTLLMKGYLILFGILEVIVPLIAINSLFTLSNLQKTLGTNSITTFLGLGFFGFSLFLALGQIIIGFFSLDSRLGKKKTKNLIILGLILGAMSIILFPLFLVLPIYSIVK